MMEPRESVIDWAYNRRRLGVDSSGGGAAGWWGEVQTCHYEQRHQAPLVPRADAPHVLRCVLHVETMFVS
jgi:hypothetical protein